MEGAMGDGLFVVEVVWAVDGINSMFSAANQKATVKAFKSLSDVYPKLLSGKGRQGTLWFGAAVLTPQFDFTRPPLGMPKQKYGYPGNSFRRWIKWLMWLSVQKYDTTAEARILNVINLYLSSTDPKAAINWVWKEDRDFDVTILGNDKKEPVATNCPWTVTVTSIGINPNEIDDSPES